MKYKVNILSGKGLNELIKAVEKRKKWLKDKTQLLLTRLADKGYQVASYGFSTDNAIYDGTNDVMVNVEDRGDTTRAVVATGATVLFIEFGTGITYADDHPEKPHGLLGRGEYGLGNGKRKTWGYYGEPGTNGVEVTRNGKTVVLTHGNPANKPMYEAAKQLREDLPKIVKEVFGND